MWCVCWHVQTFSNNIYIYLTVMIDITEVSALYILGEIGMDMPVWRDSASLTSWAALSPANNESANKKKSTKIGNGGYYLKPLLVQCALAIVKSTKKATYFYYKYQTLKKRRGHKKATKFNCQANCCHKTGCREKTGYIT